MDYSIIILDEEQFIELHNILSTDDDYDISNIINNYDHYNIDEYIINTNDELYFTNTLKPKNEFCNIADANNFFNFKNTYFIIYDNNMGMFFKIDDASSSQNSKRIVDDNNNVIDVIRKTNNIENQNTITFNNIYKITEYSYPKTATKKAYGVYIYELSFYQGNEFIEHADANNTFANVTFYYGVQSIFNIKINNDMYYYNISHSTSDDTLYIKFDLNMKGAALYSIFQRIFRPEDNEETIQSQFEELFYNFKENKYYILNINNNKYLIQNTLSSGCDIYDFMYLIVENIISYMSNEEIINLLNDSVIKSGESTSSSSALTRYSSFFWRNIKKLFNNTKISSAASNKEGVFYNGYYDVIFSSANMQNNNILYNLEDKIVIKDDTVKSLNEYNLYINNEEYHKNECFKLYKQYIKKYMVTDDDDKIDYLFNKYNVEFIYNLIDNYKKQYNVTYILKLK